MVGKQMARTKNAGNGLLEEALATLIQNQAVFRMTPFRDRPAFLAFWGQ